MRHSRRGFVLITIILFALSSTACLAGAPATQQNPVDVQPTQQAALEEETIESTCNDPMDGPTRVSGSFTYTNEFLTEYYYSEHTVLLYDLTGYVTADPTREVPVEAQILGYSEINEDTNNGHFILQLPLKPQGSFNDVDHSGTYNVGVQIYALDYNPNMYGSPYGVGADAIYGWPSYLASVKMDTEYGVFIEGGQMIIWAQDCNQKFPTGFGKDGILFTGDEPLGAVAAGYTMVDLDQEPFVFSRDEELVMELYEPEGLALKDFSDKSYTIAFNEMFEILRKEYAFNGIDGKQPDYDVLYNEIYPRIVAAETDLDWDSYYSALFDFTLAFNDGHVSLDGGDDGLLIRFADIIFGYGFSVKEMDTGEVLVYFVSPSSSAESAGIHEGYQILEVDDIPIDQAISNVISVWGPYSTDFAERLDQTNLLFRTGEYQKSIEVKYVDLSGKTQTATLYSGEDELSYYASFRLKFDDPVELPVVYTLLGEKIGYIRVNSNYDDLNLSIRLFERALKTFEDYKIEGLILDLRENYGGAPIGIAGLFTDQKIELANLEYYKEQTGQFEIESVMTFSPYPQQFHFGKMVTLIGPNCYSACELEAYGLSQVPGMEVIGFYPTAGVEADVSRGTFVLPEDILLEVPTGRLTMDDGSLFLEGQGVQPSIRVPVDEKSVFKEDPVLDVAVTYILN